MENFYSSVGAGEVLGDYVLGEVRKKARDVFRAIDEFVDGEDVDELRKIMEDLESEIRILEHEIGDYLLGLAGKLETMSNWVR